MAYVGVQLNMDKLLELERESHGRAAQIVQKMAQDCEALIGLSWNQQSPAPAGETPGVDTGNLKNDVIAVPADDDDLAWWILDQSSYGIHHEFGTENMPARPWMLPAVEETAANVSPDLLMGIVNG